MIDTDFMAIYDYRNYSTSVILFLEIIIGLRQLHV